MTARPAAKATEKTFAKGFRAWFDKGRTGVFVNLVKNTDGTYNLVVLGRSGDCGHKTPGFGHGHGGWGHWRSRRVRLGRSEVDLQDQVPLSHRSLRPSRPDRTSIRGGRRRASGVALFGLPRPVLPSRPGLRPRRSCWPAWSPACWPPAGARPRRRRPAQLALPLALRPPRPPRSMPAPP